MDLTRKKKNFMVKNVTLQNIYGMIEFILNSYIVALFIIAPK